MEVWTGNYAGRLFRITVKFGKIVEVEGDLSWAKGMRIRHFKRTVWKYGGPNSVEREPDEIRTIEVQQPMGEAGEETQDTSQRVSEGERTVGEGPGGCKMSSSPCSMPEVQEAQQGNAQHLPLVRLLRRGRINITPAMSLRTALKAARHLGCFVYIANRTGEVRIAHPTMSRRINANCRRKDAPRKLTTFLTQLQDSLT